MRNDLQTGKTRSGLLRLRPFSNVLRLSRSAFALCQQLQNILCFCLQELMHKRLQQHQPDRVDLDLISVWRVDAVQQLLNLSDVLINEI